MKSFEAKAINIINRHPKLQIVLNGQMGITLYVVRRYDGLCLDLDIEILDVSGPSLITDKSDCADFGLDLDICQSGPNHRFKKSRKEVTKLQSERGPGSDPRPNYESKSLD